MSCNMTRPTGLKWAQTLWNLDLIDALIIQVDQIFTLMGAFKEGLIKSQK